MLRQLRQEGVQLPNGNALPALFEFTELELSANPRLLSFLLPAGNGGDGTSRVGSAAGGAAAAGGGCGGGGHP